MKKITCVLLTVVMLAFVLSMTALAADPAAGMEAHAEVSYDSGLVTLVFTATESATNAKATVQYDAKALTYEGAEIGGTVSSTAAEEGEVTFGFATSCADALAVGDTVATLRFTALPDTESTTVTVTVTEWNESSGTTGVLKVNVSMEPDAAETPDAGNGGTIPSIPVTPTTPTTPPTTEIPEDPTPGSGADDVTTSVKFDDVESGRWSYDAISYVAGQGYFKGTSDTKFSPTANMTRAMFVTVLGRMAGAGENTSAVTAFRDVAAGEYYTGYVAWAASNGIVKGISDTAFAPNANVTREQMAVFLYRYAKYLGMDVSVKNSGTALSAFSDAGSVSSWAVDAMTWAVSNGIINGTGKGLEPQSFATREQVAQIIYKFDKLSG
jgi:hypothetical protein